MAELRKVDFEVGQQFESFDDLEKLLALFSQQNYIQLWKRDCKTKEAAMRRCPKRANLITPEVKYYHLEYCCIHGGQKFRQKGNGQRQTSTFKKACPFSLKFDASPNGNHLILTSYINRHENHEISAALFKHLPKQRRLSKEDEARASSLMEMQANKQLVQMKLTEETGRVITLRDLSNIASRSKLDASRNNLENCIKSLREKYNATVEVLTNGNELAGVFFQDQHMKHAYKSSPEFLCMDATYKLLELRFSVFIIMCVDGGGVSEVACVGLLVDEDEISIQWLLESFKRHNDEWSQTRVFMTDKDLKERSVIRTSFPDVALLICLFHTLRSFNREITTHKLGITPGQRFVALELVQKIAYASSHEQYNALYDQLTASVATPVLDYYRSNWHDIRNEWVFGLNFSTGSFMNTTNNRLERLNGQLKAVIQRNSSLEEFIEKFYVVMQSLRNEHFHKVAYEFQKVKASKHAPDSPEDLCVKSLTRYAADFVLHQLALLSKVQGFVAMPGHDDVYTLESHEGQLKVTITSCHCIFRRAMALPCRHILALRRQVGTDLFDITLCDKRWLLSTYKQTQSLFESSENYESTLNVSTTEVVRKPLTQHQKFRLASKEIFDLPALLSEVGSAEFKRRINVLRQLKKGWQDGHIMMVGPANADGESPCFSGSLLQLQDSPECQMITGNSEGEDLPVIHEHSSLLPGDHLPLPCSIGNLPDRSPSMHEPENNQPEILSLSDIQVPANIKKRGRPKGSECTTIGLPRKKARELPFGPQPFLKLSADTKSRTILKWLGVHESDIQTAIKSKELINTLTIDAESLNSAVLDEHVDIYMVRKLFTNQIWQKITKAVDDKRQANVWLCGHCNKDLNNDGAIACDACFTWFHLPCCAMTRAPKKRTWICAFCFHAASLTK